MVMDQVQVLRAACCIAGLDQEVCERERTVLDKIAYQIGVGEASLNAMIDRAKSDPNFYEEQFHIASLNPDPAIKTIAALAAADHEITDNERIILQHFAQKLGMDDARFEKIFASAQKLAKAGKTEVDQLAEEEANKIDAEENP